MPISKEVTLASGVVVNYHRVDALSMRFDGKDPAKPISFSAEVGSYLNAGAATGGMAPVTKRLISATTDAEPNLAGIYAWLVAPIQYEEVQTPVVGPDGKVTTTTAQRALTQDTGFSGATLV